MRPLRRFKAGLGHCGKTTSVHAARGYPMSDEKRPMSKRTKVVLWALFGIAVPLFALGLAAEFIEIEDDTPTPMVLVPTPTLVPIPTPEPTLTPTVMPASAPTVVVIRVTEQEWQKLISATERATTHARATSTARARASTARATATKIANNNYRVGNSSSSRSIQVSHSVRSNNNLVGRKQISLSSGRYVLSKNNGCVAAELASLPSDSLVASLSGTSSKSVNIQSGRYILRAIGNGCIATLTK